MPQVFSKKHFNSFEKEILQELERLLLFICLSLNLKVYNLNPNSIISNHANIVTKMFKEGHKQLYDWKDSLCSRMQNNEKDNIENILLTRAMGCNYIKNAPRCKYFEMHQNFLRERVNKKMISLGSNAWVRSKIYPPTHPPGGYKYLRQSV